VGGPNGPIARGLEMDMDELSPPVGVFEEDAVSLEPLRDRTVAILGYGNQGHAHALNLRDSGIEVVVGARAGGAGAARAVDDGFVPLEIGDAAAMGDIVMILLPDEVQRTVYADEVAARMRPGAALAFAHGFAVAFDGVETEPGRSCFLAAPKGQGDMLREAYAGGGGLPGLLAVAPGSPPETWDLAAAYAKAVGCLRGGGFPTTFREECVADQFGEQAVLCGGLVELLRAAYETLIDRGYAPENAYFECVHEVKLIADLLHRAGVDGMRKLISPTAAYGGLTRGPRLVDDRTRAEMGRILDEIESGAFAAEFIEDSQRPHGASVLEEKRALEARTGLAETGRRLRDRLNNLGLGKGPRGGRHDRD